MFFSLLIIYGSFAAEFVLSIEGNPTQVIDAFGAMLLGMVALVACMVALAITPRNDVVTQQQSEGQFGR